VEKSSKSSSADKGRVNRERNILIEGTGGLTAQEEILGRGTIEAKRGDMKGPPE